MSVVGGSDGSAHPTATILYHCVCGSLVPVSVEVGGECGSCGRRYSPEAARLAGSETIRMPIDLSQSIDLNRPFNLEKSR
jgi:hypothetical protein